jgi:hypothetical protein
VDAVLDESAVLRGQLLRNVVLIKLQMPAAIWVEGAPDADAMGARSLNPLRAHGTGHAGHGRGSADRFPDPLSGVRAEGP